MRHRVIPPRGFDYKHEPLEIPGLDIERIRVLRDSRLTLFSNYRDACRVRSADEALSRAARFAYQEEVVWAMGQIGKTVRKAVEIKQRTK